MTSVRRRSIAVMLLDVAGLALNVWVLATGRGSWVNVAGGLALIVAGCVLLYYVLRRW